jgi:hypothetical protein
MVNWWWEIIAASPQMLTRLGKSFRKPSAYRLSFHPLTPVRENAVWVFGEETTYPVKVLSTEVWIRCANRANRLAVLAKVEVVEAAMPPMPSGLTTNSSIHPIAISQSPLHLVK